jgi:two-component system OmpR family response regulator
MFRGYVVEDNPSARAALAEALAELAGVTTVGFAGEQAPAIAWLTNPGNDWDIAIVDLQLGSGGSGYRVLSALSQRQPHQRVVAWTDSADALARARCRILGCDRIFDRTTDVNAMMDFCTAESEAQALGPTGDRFPSEPHSRGSSAASRRP